MGRSRGDLPIRAQEIWGRGRETQGTNGCPRHVEKGAFRGVRAAAAVLQESDF